MFLKQLIIKMYNKKLSEKIEKEIINSFRKKDINVFKIRIDLDSGALCLGVYMDGKLYKAV